MRTSLSRRPRLSRFTTRFGSLEDYERGHLEIIDDEPFHYAFSNVYEVASRARPYEKIAVGKNRQYVLEAIRAEGTSEWRTCSHDEFALVMDGEVRVELAKLGDGQRPDAEREGSVALEGEPAGPRMGEIVARRGHMALLPHGAAYRFHADRPGVILLQTIEGRDTVYKWAEIIQTTT
jgi:hypothetical protein